MPILTVDKRSFVDLGVNSLKIAELNIGCIGGHNGTLGSTGSRRGLPEAQTCFFITIPPRVLGRQGVDGVYGDQTPNFLCLPIRLD